jgi:hypothetical protein
MQVGSISGSGFQSEPAPPSPAVPEPDAPVVLPQDEVVLTSTSPRPSAAETPAADDAASPAEAPSGLAAFTYGALGVAPPAGQTSSDPSYSAGQWTGAAMKVGAIVALLV